MKKRNCIVKQQQNKRSSNNIIIQQQQYSEDSEEDEDSERSEDPKWQLYWTVRNYDVVGGVPLCQNFMELPSKRNYPDYYEEIERPMSLYIVNKKLKRNSYTTLAALADDLLLMFQNACLYNIEDSDIFRAAQRLRKLTLDTAKSLDPNFQPSCTEEEEQEQVRLVKVEVEEAEEQNNQFEGHDLLHKSSTSSSTTTTTTILKNGAMPAAAETVSVAAALGKRKRLLMSSSPSMTPEKCRVSHKKKVKLENGFPEMGPSCSKATSLQKQSSNRSAEGKAAARPAAGGGEQQTKKGRKSIDELRERFAKTLMDVWQDMRNLKMGERILTEPFVYLPCDRTFPDYYSMIKQPISLTCIQNKIVDAKYNNSDELVADVKLMCANARAYNRPGSQIVTDSYIIESVATGSMGSRTGGSALIYPLRCSEKGPSQDRKSPEKKAKKKAGETTTTVDGSGTALKIVPASHFRPHPTEAGVFIAVGPQATGSSAGAAAPPARSYAQPLSSATPSRYISPALGNMVGMTTTPKAGFGSPLLNGTLGMGPQPSTSSQATHHYVIQQQTQQPGRQQSQLVSHQAGGGQPAAIQQQTVVIPAGQQAIVVNGTTVYIPANAQTIILPPGYTGPQQQHQIVVHTNNQQQHPQQQSQLNGPSSHPAQHHQIIIQQQTAASSSSSSAYPQSQQHHQLVNGAMVAQSSGGHGSSTLLGSQYVTATSMPSGSSAISSGPLAQALHGHGPAASSHQQFSVQSPTSSGAMPSTQAQQSQQASAMPQVPIDPGRTVLIRQPEPTFVAPSNSVQVKRALHSEAYVRYLESMFDHNSSKPPMVSRWDKALQATHRNTVVPNHRRPPYEWIRHSANGSKLKEEELVRALWQLRDHLVEGTTGIVMNANAGTAADKVPPQPPGYDDVAGPSGSGGKNGASASGNGGDNGRRKGAGS